VRDFAAVAGHAVVDAKVADDALVRLEVDGRGLDAMDRRYLACIAENYGGGPVGAETLAAAGIEAEVIDLRTLRPLDVETIVASVKKTNRVVSVEEGWPFAGMGAEIAATIMEHAFDWLDAPVLRVTGRDVPMPYAANLEKLALPGPDDVVVAVHAVTYR
jgi:pyruvate dehydrogenase E1 component beta subunit